MGRSRSILVAVLAAVVAMAAAQEAPGNAAEVPSPEEVYAQFNEFCRLNFGAEKEPLVYEKFGRELRAVDGGDWRHVSERSATIAWQTNLPAKGMVEYGTTPQYGSITPEPERHFYIHVYTLHGLEPATTYHYRTVSVDEQGHRLVSKDMTLTTRPGGHAIELPGEVAGPPYVLDRPGSYVLTRDVTADGTAIQIMADDVTLDLGGHTVVYDNRPMGPIEGDVWDYFEKSAVGVRVGKRRLTNVRILNGTIRQGAGDDAAQANGVGFNPLVSHSGCTGEIAGLTVEYHGPQVRGLKLSYGPDYDVHHNVITDRGTVVTNRHQGTVAIEATPRVHHNLIKRARHRGIDGISGGKVFHNEIYVDSWATNSFGIGWYKSRRAEGYGNRIFGTGYLVVGIATVSDGVGEIKVHDNLVHLQATAPADRWAEYGDQSGAYCYRITWGGEDIEVYDNLFVTKGRDGGMVRGIWACPEPGITGVVFHDNVIKAVAENEKTTLRGAIVVCGPGDGGPDAPMTFRNNLVLSNFCHVLLGENYGSGMNARFLGNRFAKAGPARDDYRAIQIGFWNQPTAGHQFVDSEFEEGTSYDHVKFEGTSERRDFSVGWTLSLATAPGAEVKITDRRGEAVFSGRADEQGRLGVPLMQYVHRPDGKTPLTPHTISLTAAGRTLTRQVEMDRPRQLEIRP